MAEGFNDKKYNISSTSLPASDSAERTAVNEAIDSRLTDFRSKMAQRTEVAKIEAEKKHAMLDYEDEYRQKLTVMKKKQDEEKLQEKRLMEEKLEEARQKEREREIAEFIRREREEAEERDMRSKTLVEAAANRSSMSNGTPRGELLVENDIKTTTSDAPKAPKVSFESISRLADSLIVDIPETHAEQNPVSKPQESNAESLPDEKVKTDVPLDSIALSDKATDTEKKPEKDLDLTIQINSVKAPLCDSNRILEIPEIRVKAIPVRPPMSYPQYENDWMPVVPRSSSVERTADTKSSSVSTFDKKQQDSIKASAKKISADASEIRSKDNGISDSEYLNRLQRLSDGHRELLMEEEKRILREIDEIKAQRAEIAKRREALHSRQNYYDNIYSTEIAAPVIPNDGYEHIPEYVNPISDTSPNYYDDINAPDYKGLANKDISDDEWHSLGLTLSDAKAIKEYEKHMSRGNGKKILPDDYERPLLGEGDRAVLPEIHSDPGELAVEPDPNIPDIDLLKIAEEQKNLDKSELPFRLNQFYKEADIYSRRITRISKRQKSASHSENVKLIVEKIGNARVVIEIYEEALLACVYTDSKRQAAKHKSILEKKIALYNGLIDEYEEQTGKSLTRLSRSFASDIIKTEAPKEIPVVRYIGENVNAAAPIEPFDDEINQPSNVDSHTDYYDDGELTDSRAEIEDQLRFLKEYEADQRLRDADADTMLSLGSDLSVHDRKMAAKLYEERMRKIKASKEKDELVIRARTEYNIAKLEAKRDLAALSFTTNKHGNSKEISLINKDIERLRSHLGKSLRLEREDNNCYYRVFTEKESNKKYGKRTDRRRLESIKMRLEVLLAERDEINDSLIKMYGVTAKNKISKEERKLNAVRRRHAKAMYRTQKKDAKRLERLHAPLDLKEKVYKLMNRCTELVSNIESSRYKLHKTTLGSQARKSLRQEIKKHRADLKATKSDIRYLMKKVGKHHDKHTADIRWAGWVILVLLLVVGGVLLWKFYGEVIWKYIGWVFG